MEFITDYRLENFILNTRWEELPQAVRDRAVVCCIDLVGALVIGSRSRQFDTGVRLSRRIFSGGHVKAVGANEFFSFMGAATVMGHASNAFDIDDGHNIIRAHPGTSFIGGLMAAAFEKNVTYREFLTALVVSYEATIRMGRAMIDYYKYYHSSGTFGAFGTAASVGRIYGLSKEQLNNALSIAEFNAPIVPASRSVEYPSMNKDGVPFGVMIGALAVLESLSGFTGNKHLLEMREHKHYNDDLGTEYEILNLYFKPYTCCRWAHPAIDACLSVMSEHGVKASDIERVVIKTFAAATRLSKVIPHQTDEAQYNIAYPVASAIVHGDFGFEQAIEKNLGDPEVSNIMERLSFEVDAEIDAKFPAKRFCRAELFLKSGDKLVSADCQPRGEAGEGIGLDWISEKFRRVTRPILAPKAQVEFLELITGEVDRPMRELIDRFNQKENWLK
jgi:2-methylcitrate dehydratase PrpD